MNKAASPPGDLPTKVVAALDRLARGQRSFRQAIASRHGLTPLQVELLTTLAEGPPPVPLVGLLASELGVTQPTVTDSVRALELKFLVERRTDSADRRRTTVVLTPTGRRLAADLAAADNELIDAVSALDRPSQEAALETVLTLIRHLVDTGTISVSRTCFTCRFHQQADTGEHRCTLLNLELPPAELRVNCAEHVPA